VVGQVVPATLSTPFALPTGSTDDDAGDLLSALCDGERW
jgi:hypothetical protein